MSRSQIAKGLKNKARNNRALRPFLSSDQLEVLAGLTRGEEGEYFSQKIEESAKRITGMAKTYETDGQGEEALVVLHYFTGGSDWYITERDMEQEQLQAFGFAVLNGDTQNAELGQIPICEITKHGAELDIHWTPKPLKTVKSALFN